MMQSHEPQSPSAGSGRRWKVVVGTLAGIILGGVFLVAVYGKVFDPQAFAEAIRADGLDFLIPSEPLAWLMLAAEAAIGLVSQMSSRYAFSKKTPWLAVPCPGWVWVGPSTNPAARSAPISGPSREAATKM